MASANEPTSSSVLPSLTFAAGAAVASLVWWWAYPASEAPAAPAPEPSAVQLETRDQPEHRGIDSHTIDLAPKSSAFLGHLAMEGGKEAALVVLVRGSAALHAASQQSGAPLVVRAGDTELRTRIGVFNVTLEKFKVHAEVVEGGLVVVSPAGVKTLSAGESWPAEDGAAQPGSADGAAAH